MTAGKQAKFDEIRKRYRKRRRHFGGIASLRVRELSALFRGRYGEHLPDDAEGRQALELMAHHFAALGSNPFEKTKRYAQERAPWLTLAGLEEILASLHRPKRWKADRLAWLLKLADTDRARLKITTIGAVDVSAAERKERRLARARGRKLNLRRAQGAVSRKQYEEKSASRCKPWQKLNMSRSTWYRLGKP